MSSVTVPSLSSATPYHPLFLNEGAQSASWLVNPEEERRRLVSLIPQTLSSIVEHQTGSKGREAGGIITGEGVVCGRATAFAWGTLASCRVFAEEAGIDVHPLNHSLMAAAAFLVKRQSQEGWLDLGGRYSPNEAGFPTTGMMAGWKRLKELHDPELDDALQLIGQFCRKAADALVREEAYTANHRWTAVSAPLAAVHSVWPEDRYLAKIEEYLSDGIDCDSIGCWYEERSPNYNDVANEGVWEMANLLDRPDLLEHVRRSGEYILQSLQPNGEANASFSFRQDRGMTGRRPMSYVMARRLARLAGDGQYTTLAATLFPESKLPSAISPLLFDVEDFPKAYPAPEPVKVEVEDVAEGELPVVRMREGRTALTLCSDEGDHFFTNVFDQWGGPKRSEDWIHLHQGDVVVQSVHLVGSGQSSIQPQHLDVLNHRHFRLHGDIESSLHALNFRPNPRDIQLPWHFRFSSDITMEDDRLLLKINASNQTSIYATLAFYIRPGVQVREGGNHFKVRAGESYALQGGGGVVIQGQYGKVELMGLPASEVQKAFDRTPGIPSAVRNECGALTLGLFFPVDLEFTFQLGVPGDTK